MVLVMVVVLGQIALIHGATKIPYSWCCCWTVGLIVLTRGGEADQESHPHFFSALVALVVVEKYMDGSFWRRGEDLIIKGN